MWITCTGFWLGPKKWTSNAGISKSRNLNQDSVVICLFYQCLSRTFQGHSMHILKLWYWHFLQGLQYKGVYQRNLSVKTVSWRYDLATFSVKLAGPLQQVPGIVNVVLWNVFVYVHADPAVATLPDNKGSVWGEKIQNSHYCR